MSEQNKAMNEVLRRGFKRLPAETASEERKQQGLKAPEDLIRIRGELDCTLRIAVPLGDRDGPPDGTRIFGHDDREVGQTLAL